MSESDQGCSQSIFFTEALAEFQHVNCMIVRSWEVKTVACYAGAETFTEAVASVIATPLLMTPYNKAGYYFLVP